MTTTDGRETHLAFAGDQCLLRGSLVQVALASRRALDRGESRPILVLDAITSQVVDLDLRGTDAEIAARLASAEAEPARSPQPTGNVPAVGPGRPRLGVVSREVSLLPRHWDWLRTQRGGASAALRRLVDEARRASGSRNSQVAAQESVDRFLRITCGDRPHYEEALRAFYAGRDDDLQQLVSSWPTEILGHLNSLVRRCRDPQLQ